MRVDQRRIYVHGLSERAGHGTSSGTKPRQRCPRTHAISAFNLVLPNVSQCAAATSFPPTTQRRARRKASSIHAHVSAAGPRPSHPHLLQRNEECPHYTRTGLPLAAEA